MGKTANNRPVNARRAGHAALEAVEPMRQRVSDYGHKRGWEWLEYDPLTMWHFHKITVGDAGPIAAALDRCFPHAHSLVDVGAGTGAISAAWKARGHVVLACERNGFARFMARMQGVETRKFSLTDEPPALVNEPFDLALCLEVAEHIPEQLAPRLIDFLSQVAPTVVFSHATEGQGGHFHLNEQPWSYWDELFKGCGMNQDPEGTAALRRALPECGCTASFRIDNTFVLRRQPRP